ncbi:MAG TPA: DUF3108 domain-containing protein [Woeseiaceae bacterium]|nr:DUF3108 domain-containing protein [Woeseiaceae bacterium]
MRFAPSSTYLLPALLLLWSGPGTPATGSEQALTPHSAVYKVKISVLSGELHTRLSRADDRYVAVHRVAPTGMARMLVNGTIEETSGFEVAHDGVRPLHYTSVDTISGDESEADFTFDWAEQSVAGELDGKPVTMEFDGEAHDRISIQYAMMHDMLAGETGKRYVLFDIDEFKTLEISNIGTREIDVPAGRFTAIGIRHQAKGSSRVTTLWCVPELDFLPAIIEQHRKGELKMRATLARYEADSRSG